MTASAPSFARALELLVAARGDNHLCSGRFGDLQAENGNSTGPQEKNGFAGNKLAPDDQRLPGGHCGTG